MTRSGKVTFSHFLLPPYYWLSHEYTPYIPHHCWTFPSSQPSALTTSGKWGANIIFIVGKVHHGGETSEFPGTDPEICMSYVGSTIISRESLNKAAIIARNHLALLVWRSLLDPPVLSTAMAVKPRSGNRNAHNSYMKKSGLDDIFYGQIICNVNLTCQ